MGGTPDGPESNVTEEYDGTSWASGGNLGTANSYFSGCGTQSAGLCTGGGPSIGRTATEEYDGTCWSSGGNLATGRYALGVAGIQSAAIAMGGAISTEASSAVTEDYNGTAWSSGGAMATARQYLAGAGTRSAGLSIGGRTGSALAVTEEYDSGPGSYEELFTPSGGL